MGRKEKGRKHIWRRLDRRLMVLISLIVIPVNFLTILLGTLTVREAKGRVLDTYAREFGTYVNREMQLYDRLDEWYKSYILKYRDSMMSSYLFSSMDSINMVNEINAALNVYGVRGFFFLKENAEDEKLYFKGSRGLYGEETERRLCEAVKERLLTEEIWAETGWRIEEFDGRPYYFICYRYKNYIIGLGMDLQEQFAGWLEGEAMEDCLIWLFGEERAVVWNGLGDCRFLESTEEGMEREVAEEMQAEETGQDSVWVQMTVGGKENRVCLSGIRMGQVVPAAYRVLLYLSYASLILLGLIWILIRRQVINPLQVLQEGLKALDGEAYYRIEDTARTEDFAYIYQTFNKMADDILLSHERELQLYQTQLDNLKLQVNPHMLLNSLTTIYSLVQTRQYPTIQKFVMDLVEYFRYCLRENDGLVTLESELQFVENYMGIQKVRYPGEMSYGYQAEPGVEKALLPPLLIQNFVENAVKYARIPDAVIEILVNVRREEGKLYVSVCDTGQGMAEEVQKRLNNGEAYTDGEGRKHIGVWNCRRRLELFYGQEALLRINSSPGKGTQVWMELPYSAQREVEEREAGVRL